MNKSIFDAARVACGVFAMITALGWLWFAGRFSAYWNMYALVNFVAFVVGALSPSKAYDSKYRNAYMSLYIFAIMLTLPILYLDFNLINGSDYPAMMIRGAECIVLGVLAKEGKRKKQLE